MSYANYGYGCGPTIQYYPPCPPVPVPGIIGPTGPTGAVGSIGATGYTGPTGPAGAKTFIIDHPVKLDNYLVHACLEGPEAGVYYRGTATISDEYIQDSIYFVEVELPDYVTSLAKDFTVYVTPIFEDKLRVVNATKVKDNKFRIYGDPGPVNWIVYGTRSYFEVEPYKSEIEVKGNGPYKWI
jgi:hypothetical protein